MYIYTYVYIYIYRERERYTHIHHIIAKCNQKLRGACGDDRKDGLGLRDAALVGEIMLIQIMIIQTNNINKYNNHDEQVPLPVRPISVLRLWISEGLTRA